MQRLKLLANLAQAARIRRLGTNADTVSKHLKLWVSLWIFFPCPVNYCFSHLYQKLRNYFFSDLGRSRAHYSGRQDVRVGLAGEWGGGAGGKIKL